MTEKIILPKGLAFEAACIYDTIPNDSLTRENVECGFDISVSCLEQQLGDDAYIYNTCEHLDAVISNKEKIINAVMYGWEVEDD